MDTIAKKKLRRQLLGKCKCTGNTAKLWFSWLPEVLEFQGKNRRHTNLLFKWNQIAHLEEKWSQFRVGSCLGRNCHCISCVSNHNSLPDLPLQLPSRYWQTLVCERSEFFFQLLDLYRDEKGLFFVKQTLEIINRGTERKTLDLSVSKLSPDSLCSHSRSHLYGITFVDKYALIDPSGTGT